LPVTGLKELVHNVIANYPASWITWHAI